MDRNIAVEASDGLQKAQVLQLTVWNRSDLVIVFITNFSLYLFNTYKYENVIIAFKLEIITHYCLIKNIQIDICAEYIFVYF